MRLASERSALPWETQTTLHIPRAEADATKRDKILQALRTSDRVKASVKEKTDDELLDHYQLAQGDTLTNLGVLCLARQFHRAQLTTAPVIQFIKLTQRERIALGLLAQHDAMTARELASKLELPSVDALPPWLKRLLDWQLVQSTGRTRAMRYFVDPALLCSLDFVGGTTLKRIEPHRLLALIVKDVGRYPQSRIGNIHQRIGLEIPRSRIRRSVEQLVKDGKLKPEGVGSGTRYRLP